MCVQEEVTRLQSKVQELERGRKSEINSLRLKYDAKVTRLLDIQFNSIIIGELSDRAHVRGRGRLEGARPQDEEGEGDLPRNGGGKDDKDEEEEGGGGGETERETIQFPQTINTNSIVQGSASDTDDDTSAAHAAAGDGSSSSETLRRTRFRVQVRNHFFKPSERRSKNPRVVLVVGGGTVCQSLLILFSSTNSLRGGIRKSVHSVSLYLALASQINF